MRKYLLLLGLFLNSQLFAGTGNSPVNEKELIIREAFYHAHQGDCMDAVARLDIALGRLNGPDSKNPGPMHFHAGKSQFSAGDFELECRMYQRAVMLLEAIVESKPDKQVRNEAAYNISKIHMQKGEHKKALLSIEKISGEDTEEIGDEELFLRAQIFLANGEFAGAARLLQKVQKSKSYKEFAGYNMGIALMKIGQEKQGLDQLDKVGEMSGNDEITLAIKDKANLTLGLFMLDTNQPARAKKYLNRVRSEGPFSNRALFGSGWAEAADGHFERALALWTILSSRNETDRAVHESVLGVPYAYSELKLSGKSAMYYGKAVEVFDKEKSRIDRMINNVREGTLLRKLEKLEIQQADDLIASLGNFSKEPENQYLVDLLMTSTFQESLRNYFDLNGLLSLLDEKKSYLALVLGEQRKYRQVKQLEKKIDDTRRKISDLLVRQGDALEAMALGELYERRKEIEGYQVDARVALADSYERAKIRGSDSSVE